LPCAVDLGVVDRKSFLEICCAMNLSCYEYHPFD
jgi:hypothetical protein